MASSAPWMFLAAFACGGERTQPPAPSPSPPPTVAREQSSVVADAPLPPPDAPSQPDAARPHVLATVEQVVGTRMDCAIRDLVVTLGTEERRFPGACGGCTDGHCFATGFSARIERVGERDVALLMETLLGVEPGFEELRYQLVLEACGKLFVSKPFAETTGPSLRPEYLELRARSTRLEAVVVPPASSRRPLYRLDLATCPPVERVFPLD